MGTASMRKWLRRYGSREDALHARLRERRRRELLRRDSRELTDTPAGALEVRRFTASTRSP